MTVVAHIWSFKGSSEAWGHASVQVIGGGNDCYISWWPSGAGREPAFPKAASANIPIFGSIYSAPANKNQSFVTDKSSEGQDPDYSLKVLGLSEAGIANWWQDFQKAPPPWTTLDTNCSMVAAYALRAGGCDEVIAGMSGWWHSWNSVWTPNDVKLLVEAINKSALASAWYERIL